MFAIYMLISCLFLFW